MKLTDGTMLNFIAVDVDDNGDVTFGERDGLEYMRPFHTVSNVAISWKDSRLRQYLSSDFISLIPSNVKNAIKEKTATYQIAPNSSTATESASDKVWIPTMTNLSLIYSGSGEKETGHKVLEYYKNVDNRKKPTHTKIMNWDGNEFTGGTNQWKTATPANKMQSTYYYLDVSVSGTAMTLAMTTASIIVPHFIIGAQ